MSSAHRRRVAYAQNFLRNRRLIDRLLARSGIGPDDLVVEIGPGKGAITERLAPRCRQVLAVEKDPGLAEHLRARFAGAANVAVFETDFLGFPLPISGYKVCASIPFNITTAVITKLTSGPSATEDAYLVVQWEAAARLLGEPQESLYGVLLKPWFEPTLVHRFRREDFVPAPQVDVVMLRLRKRGPPLVAPGDAPLFRDLVVHAFTAWQPTVGDALARVLRHGAAQRLARQTGLDLGRAPSAVRFDEWLALFAAFRTIGDERARRALAGAEARLQRQQARIEKVHRTRVAGRTE